ncbi:MAG TPA: cation:proton antiporter [Thermoanaerobaculia bacterium]|nr:cation:proton antiporter [Thermoanaerobaculia bacterium]
MAVLIVVLVAAVAIGAGRLARLLGQPTMIGYVATGVVAALVVPHDAAFRDALHISSLLGELGVLVLMFTSGAEMDSGELWSRARRGVPLTLSVIATPFVCGLFLAPRFPQLRGDSADPIAFTILIATCMTVTAFPVLIEILRDRRLLTTRIGAISVGTAAVDDLFLWLMLAVLAVLVHRQGSASTLLRLVLAFTVALPLAVVLARFVFRRVRHFAVVILFTAAVIAVMAWLGVHPVFVAFFIGTAMPHAPSTGAALVTLRRVGMPFLPLFFVAIGMHVASVRGEVAVAAIFIGVAVVAKIVPATLVSRLRGESWRTSFVLGSLLNARGAMELIAAKLGLELGLLSPAGFSVIVSVAVVTTLITGPLLRMFYSPSLGSTTAAAVSSSDAAA